MLVIAKIIDVDKHPSADKLIVTQVEAGPMVLQIVTNDITLKVGDKVVVATVGHDFGFMKIEERKLRGVTSFGMFCGFEVTGIGREADGVTRLNEDAVVGSIFSRE